jgi:hypothetical protein
MRSYNPKKKAFTYTAESLAQAPATRANIRTTIQSDSWFELHGIIGQTVFAAGGAPVMDAVYINLFDEGTGRNLFSAPLSCDALFPNIGRQIAINTTAAGAVGYLFRRPFYFPTPFIMRPSATLRTEVDNRNVAGDGALTLRIAFIGLKAYDLNFPEQSPGLTFHPFIYVADFGTLLANSQQTQTIAVQSDSDFDITAITASWPLLNSAPADVFMNLVDLGSSYQLEDRALPIHHYAGGPHFPYYPIRPYRLAQTGGMNVTLQNTTVANILNANVAFHGYKIFK